MEEKKNFLDFENNKIIIDKLRKNILTEKINHGYIFEGPKNSEKISLAKAFAKAILCENKIGIGCDSCSTCIKIDKDAHLDVTIIEETLSKGSKTKSIKAEQIENLQEILSKTPIEGNRKIVIIKDGQTISEAGFGKLLKTLEEPPVGSVLMLLLENSKIIPETIRSRCVKYNILEESEKSFINDEKNNIIELVKLIIEKKPYYKVKPIIENFVSEKEKSLYLLDEMQLIIRDMVVYEDKNISKEYAYFIIDEIEKARVEIQNNMSRGFTIKKLALRIGG